jgi:hypothetical protein
MLDKFEGGLNISAVRCHFDVNKWVISFIKKNKTRSGEELRAVLH